MNRLVIVLAASFALLAGTAAAATSWTPGLVGSSSANAHGKGFDPPTGGGAGSATSNSLTISWTAPASGATPTSYAVYRSTSSGGTYTELTSGGCAAPATSGCKDNYELSASTPYYYEVHDLLGTNWATSTAFFSDTTSGPANLNAVAMVGGTTAGETWAVGGNCGVYFYNGTSWTQDVNVPTTCVSNNWSLNGAAVVDTSDGWIAGSGGVLVCSSTCGSATATWSAVTTSPADSSDLNAVTAALNGSTYYVYAVGTSGTILACDSSCTTTGTTWTSVGPSESSWTYTGVSTPATSGEDIWAVGYENSTTPEMAYCSESSSACVSTTSDWKTITSGLGSEQLNAVAAPATGEVYLVGNSKTVLLCNSSPCTTDTDFSAASAAEGTLASGTNVTGVSSTGSGDAMISGSGGAVSYCSADCTGHSGATWTLQSGTGTSNLSAIAEDGGSSPTGVAVGASGAYTEGTGKASGSSWSTGTV